MAADNLPPRIKVALTAVDREGFRVDGEAGEAGDVKMGCPDSR